MTILSQAQAGGVARAVGEQACAATHTPLRCVLPDVVHESFMRIRTLADQLSGLHVAYSVKTNPRPALLAAALESDFCAETISPQEVRAVRHAGFGSDRILYNGPRPLEDEHVFCAFADSPEAFDAYAQRGLCDVLGLRYRPAGIASRFGVDRDAIASCARPPSGTQLGLSFHVRPQDYAGRTWSELAAECIEAAGDLEARMDGPLVAIDFGGGLTPEALRELFEHDLPRAHALAFERLPHLRHLFIEPGQGLASPCEVLFTRIVEVRKRADHVEAVVDAGYPWLPQIASADHRIYTISDGTATLLAPGEDIVAGSTCLEYDIVSRAVHLQADCRAGDLLAVADAGAYDASMAFSFGGGVIA